MGKKRKSKAQTSASQEVSSNTDDLRESMDSIDVDRLLLTFAKLLGNLDQLMKSPDQTPSYPYDNHLLNSWFTRVVSSGKRDGTRQSSRHKLHAVDIINVDGPPSEPLQRLEEKLSTEVLRDGDKFYFHGALACHIESILENGISLECGKSKLDFSNGRGFYVTDNPKQAIQWAKKLATKRCDKPTRSGVIAFKISREMQTEEGWLSLYGDDKKDEWREVVKHFRGGEKNKRLRRKLASVKVIEGPVSFYPGKDHGQLCIRDEEYASRFGSLENIPLAIFF